MDDDIPTTCGEGLAANANIPEKLADLMKAMAGVLDGHRAALDLADPASRPEADAYAALSDAHRAVAERLAALGEQMSGYRDLPNGQHDIAAMQRPGGQAEAFARYVEVQRELAALLSAKVAEAESLL